MGTIRHNAIVCTSDFEEIINLVHKKAFEIFEGKVTNVVGGCTNGYSSFLVVPDGSKEDQDTSDEWDNKRDEFIEWINGYIFTDGEFKNEELNIYLDYVELSFGGDYEGANIIRAS